MSSAQPAPWAEPSDYQSRPVAVIGAGVLGRRIGEATHASPPSPAPRLTPPSILLGSRRLHNAHLRPVPHASQRCSVVLPDQLTHLPKPIPQPHAPCRSARSHDPCLRRSKRLARNRVRARGPACQTRRVRGPRGAHRGRLHPRDEFLVVPLSARRGDVTAARARPRVEYALLHAAACARCRAHDVRVHGGGGVGVFGEEVAGGGLECVHGAEGVDGVYSESGLGGGQEGGVGGCCRGRRGAGCRG